MLQSGWDVTTSGVDAAEILFHVSAGEGDPVLLAEALRPKEVGLRRREETTGAEHQASVGERSDLPLDVAATPQHRERDPQVLPRHPADALDEVLRAIERVLEDDDLEALGVAEVVAQLVDDDAVVDAGRVSFHPLLKRHLWKTALL